MLDHQHGHIRSLCLQNVLAKCLTQYRYQIWKYQNLRSIFERMQSINEVSVLRRAYLVLTLVVTAANLTFNVMLGVKETKNSKSLDFLSPIALALSCV